MKISTMPQQRDLVLVGSTITVSLLLVFLLPMIPDMWQIYRLWSSKSGAQPPIVAETVQQNTQNQHQPVYPPMHHMPQFGMLDYVFPGLSVMVQMFPTIMGLDIMQIGSFVLVLWFAQRLWGVLRDYVYMATRKVCSTMLIVSHDPLYKQVNKMVEKKAVFTQSRQLQCSTRWHYNFEDDENDLVSAEEGEVVNYDTWYSKTPFQYDLPQGTYRFWHKGNLFWVQKTTNSRDTAGDLMVISCLSFSIAPLKQFLNECRSMETISNECKTLVYRPTSKAELKRNNDAWLWSYITEKPTRPISTIDLEHSQKEELVLDINDYLHPKSARWYATRGIPYRRGYLFTGPPGTGKSSLSFALAGLFGLAIYTISLVDPDLTEDDLTTLFSELPDYCVVLLEDIDSAGIRKRAMPSTLQTVSGNSSTTGDEIKKSNGITLSGLLNVIDGVASHEGRVLIMTTNCPDDLDPALLRPGRVDMQVAFKLATRQQIYSLYVRMYSQTKKEKNPKKAKKDIKDSTDETAEEEPERKPQSIADAVSETVFDSIKPEVHAKALEFSDLFGNEIFSPAEVQGFLLARRKHPELALLEAPAWIESQLIKKGHKVVQFVPPPAPSPTDSGYESINVDGSKEPASPFGSDQSAQVAATVVPTVEPQQVSTTAPINTVSEVCQEQIVPPVSHVVEKQSLTVDTQANTQSMESTPATVESHTAKGVKSDEAIASSPTPKPKIQRLIGLWSPKSR